jgi:hypothetical protein
VSGLRHEHGGVTLLLNHSSNATSNARNAGVALSAVLNRVGRWSGA